MSVERQKGDHYGSKELHDQVEKASETLPDDVRKRVLRQVDDAGEEAGAMLMLDILYHLGIRDDEELAKRARESMPKAQRDEGAPAVERRKGDHYGGKELHDQVEKASATLPDDVRRRVMRWVDFAGEEAGAMLMMDLLHHLRIHKDEELSARARKAVDKHGKDGKD